MALVFNNATIPSVGSVVINNTNMKSLRLNNTEYWKKQHDLYPGTAMTIHNVGSYKPYATVNDDGTRIYIHTFGGTDAGSVYVFIGPFSTVGYSSFYVSLGSYITLNQSHGLCYGMTTSIVDNYNNWQQVFYQQFQNLSNIEHKVYGYNVSSYASVYFAVFQYSSADASGHVLDTYINDIYLE